MNVPVVTAKPAKPGAISGTVNYCPNSLPATSTYCISSVPNATSYVWTIYGSSSSPITIVSGQGSTCLTVNIPAGYTGGQKIKVKSVNCLGSSSDQYVTINILNTPNQPGSISGISSVCKSQTVGYSISSVSGATTYTWSVTGGATIFSGQGTTSAMIKFTTATSTSAIISVTASNSCGTSAARTKTVTVNLTCRISNPDVPATEISAEENIIAYPNPTHGKINLSIVANENKAYTIRISDIIGRTISSDQVAVMKGENLKEINLENRNPGIYFIHLQSISGEKIIKVIVE